MIELFITAFILGIAGSTHCLGMCGGIASSLLFSAKPNVDKWRLIAGYNFGRIFSYTLAGFSVAWLGSHFGHSHIVPMNFLQIASSVLMFLLGLYVAGWWLIIRHVERFFMPIFTFLKPLSKQLLPLDYALKAIPYGMIWGWLPCGLVYTTLTWTLTVPSPWHGAAFMLFFGMGTVPAIIAVALSSDRLQYILAHPISRKFMGSVIIIYSISLLYSAL